MSGNQVILELPLRSKYFTGKPQTLELLETAMGQYPSAYLHQFESISTHSHHPIEFWTLAPLLIFQWLDFPTFVEIELEFR